MKRRELMFAVAGAAVVAVLVGAISLARDEDGSGRRVSPTDTPADVAASPAGQPFDISSAREFRAGTPVNLPPGMVAYASPLGVGKGAPLSRVYRISRSPDGTVSSEELLERHAGQFGGPVQSIAMDWQRGLVAVAVCITGQCGYEGSTPAPGARLVMFLSRDGAETFEEVPGPVIPWDPFLFGFAGDEVIVNGTDIDADSRRTQRQLLYPSGKTLLPPAGIGKAEAFPDGRGGLWWRTFEPHTGYFAPDGTQLVAAGEFDTRLQPLGDGRLATWRPASDAAYFGFFDAAGQLIHLLRGSSSDFLTNSPLPGGAVAGTVELPDLAGGAGAGSTSCREGNPTYASLIDPGSGEARPILELAGCDHGILGLHAIVER